MTMPNTTSISVPSPMAFADAREAQRAKLRSRIDQKVAKIAHAKAAAAIEKLLSKLSKGCESATITLRGTYAVQAREIVDRHFRAAGWATKFEVIVQTATEAPITIRCPASL